MLKTKHEPLRTASWHCYTMSQLLNGLAEEREAYPKEYDPEEGGYSEAAEWLLLAAELKKINLDPYAFSDNWMCGRAADYDDARADFQEKLALTITRFVFAWNAFEIVGRILQLEPHPTKKRSLAKAATWYLKRSDVDPAKFRGYDHLLEVALIYAARHPDFDDVTIPHQDDLPYISAAGHGLDLCREVRNRLVHGLSVVPLPDDWETRGDLSDDSKLAFVNVALKLLLISIQMMMFCQLGAKYVVDDYSVVFDVSGSDVSRYLQILQLEPEESNKGACHE